jgi:hypothetical protein
MKPTVGSMEEIEYISRIIQKRIMKKENLNDKNFSSKIDIKEYRYLQYLIFKYCFIPDINLNT